MHNPMKVVFLDIDGVLNNEGYLSKVAAGRSSAGIGLRSFDPDSIDQLNRFLKETGASVGISSTWRYMHDIDSFRELFKLSGLPADSIIGTTPKTMEGHRGQEISGWLREHPEVTSYVIVDDDSDMESYQRPRFVQTTWARGLRSEHVDRMITLLNEG